MLFVIQLLSTKIYVCLQVVFYVDEILKEISCTRFKLKKDECLAFLGEYQDAQEIASKQLLCV
jgi:hypothetical protein